MEADRIVSMGAGAPAVALPVDRSLDGKLVRGLAWTGGMKWAVQVLAWLSTLVVARILSPADYGLVAMSAVYLGIVTVLSEFGLGSAVVMIRSLSDEQVAQLNGLALLAGIGAFLLSCVIGFPLGRLFHEPRLPAVVVAMSTTFTITGIATIPLALLKRELRFRELALIDGITGVVMAGAMILFALAGLRYWTLVLGVIASSTLSCVLTLRRRQHSIRWPQRDSIGPAISFSSDVVVTRLSWYLYSNADFLVAGRVLGKAALGAYSMGWTLASVPVEKVTALVLRVTPAFFSAVQHDMPAMRRYLLVLTEGISLAVFPVAIGLGLVADDFVLTVLGEKWQDGILPLRLLACYACVRSVSPLFPPVLNALGRTRIEMWINLLALLLLPSAFIIGSSWGTVGIAAAWLVAHPIIVGATATAALRLTGLSRTRYLGALWPALSACAVMAAAVGAVRLTTPVGTSDSARLALQIGAGAATYACVLIAFHRERLRAFRKVLSQVRRG